tara:strand:- start:442 stop:1527 length:1086 start_codon:yes stop_codon:yes gene_type:complete
MPRLFWPGKVIHASDNNLLPIIDTPGMKSWECTESFSTDCNSVSLSEPLECFTKNSKTEIKHWLIEDRNGLDSCFLDRGLISWKNKWLYEGSLEKYNPPGWWRLISDKPHRISLPAILMTTFNNPNYFHWATMPGLIPLMLQDYFNINNQNQQVLILSFSKKNKLPNYVDEILRIVAPEKEIYKSKTIGSYINTRFCLQQLKSKVAVSNLMTKWWNKKLENKFLSSLFPKRRLFVSRKNASRRRCLNENKLYDSLKRVGFQSVDLEKLSVINQLKIFSEASIIVSTHGAGLSNLLACRPGTKIIEMVPNNGNFSHYYFISSMLKLCHAHIKGFEVDPKLNDFCISINEIHKLLNKLEVYPL